MSAGSTVIVGQGLAVALIILVVLAVAVAAAARLGVARAVLTAAARAAVQLAAVSAIIVAVVDSWWLTAAFVLVMFATATWTSTRRFNPHRRPRPAALARTALPIAAGTVPVLAVILTCGAVPPAGIAVVPVAGIIIGGAMTATSLAGRRALDELTTRKGEYEAALSLGLLDRDAALEICRPAATLALVPPLDQTRTVGLVTLPGAFVGVLLGSGNPIQAGAAQLLVLIGLLAAEVIAVTTSTELVARGHITATAATPSP